MFLDCLDPYPFRHLPFFPAFVGGGPRSLSQDTDPPARSVYEEQPSLSPLRGAVTAHRHLSPLPSRSGSDPQWDHHDLLVPRFMGDRSNPEGPVPLKYHCPGGIYATLCPDHARNAGAHFIFSGPGEAHIPVIVKDLLGLMLDYNPDLQSLDTLPYPAYDLIPNPDALPLLTSRGCPLNCPYCASRILFPMCGGGIPFRSWPKSITGAHHSACETSPSMTTPS